MSRKVIKTLILMSLPFGLISCGVKPMTNLSFNVVTPSGAPAAALAAFASDTEHLEITAPANMPSQFVSKKADFILFDSVNGTKLAKANDGAYKLVRMVTFGNLYIVSTGNDEDGIISDDDFIVGYGEGLVPDKAYNATYDYAIDQYVADVAATAPVMLTGLIEGTKVDYVISSYPVIFAALTNENKKTDLKVVDDVSKKFSEKYSTKGFPQAGLFIKSELEANEDKKADVEAFLKAFDNAVDDLISGGTEAVKYMNAYSEDSTVQQERFGFNSNVIANVQKTNGLAFISKKDNPSATDFEKFKDPLGFEILEDSLSSYYLK